MGGVMPPFSRVPLWRSQVQICLYLSKPTVMQLDRKRWRNCGRMCGNCTMLQLEALSVGPDLICVGITYCLCLTAIVLTPGGSSTVHIYTQTVHRIQRTEHT
jgi:hypothetical protein